MFMFQGCGSAVPRSFNVRNGPITTIAQAKATCKPHETVCGIPGRENTLDFECINIHTANDSCMYSLASSSPLPHSYFLKVAVAWLPSPSSKLTLFYVFLGRIALAFQMPKSPNVPHSVVSLANARLDGLPIKRETAASLTLMAIRTPEKL